MPREWLIQHRAGTLAEWAAAEAAGPVLLAGERAYITDLKLDVVGDGVTKVAGLGAVGSGTYVPLLTDPTTVTYNGDGTVATQTVAGVATSYTYNPDGTVATETRSGTTRTYAYNSDGTLASVA